MKEEQEQGRSALSPAEELDADIAFGLMASLLHSPEGGKVAMNALKTAKNPAPALAMFVSTAMDKINNQMKERGMELSPRMWMAEGGAVDRFMDELAEFASAEGVKVPPQLESMVMAETIDQLKLQSQAGKQGQPPAPGAAPAGPPPAPQGAPPMMGPPPVDPMAGGY